LVWKVERSRENVTESAILRVEESYRNFFLISTKPQIQRFIEAVYYWTCTIFENRKRHYSIVWWILWPDTWGALGLAP